MSYIPEMFVVLAFIIGLGIACAYLVMWSFDIKEQADLCRLITNPSNSTENYKTFQHCLKYPNTYKERYMNSNHIELEE